MGRRIEGDDGSVLFKQFQRKLELMTVTAGGYDQTYFVRSRTVVNAIANLQLRAREQIVVHSVAGGGSEAASVIRWRL